MKKWVRWDLVGVVLGCAALAAACGNKGDDNGGDGDGDGGDGGDGDGDGGDGDGDAGSGGSGNSGSGGADPDGSGGDGGASSGGGTFNEGPFGIEDRPGNPNCLAPERPEFTGPVQWTFVEERLTGLIMMRQVPDGTWIEAYRNGNVYALGPDGTRGASPLFTIAGVNSGVGELGLLGLEVHPNWESSPYLFVYYTTGGTGSNTHIHIDRYTVTGSGAAMAVDTGTREVILDFDRGASVNNHVAGTIEFDPTSDPPLLYTAMGDGENRDAVQNLGMLHGKLLRFDVDAGAPYEPEIVGVGLRNPFRFSIDSTTGDLWIGDVGDDSMEEVTHVASGDIPDEGGTPLNFGWPIMEGSQCANQGNPDTFCNMGTPAILPLIPPTNAYGRSLGVSVIGGRVYRGAEVPGAFGAYFFNDVFPQGGEDAWRLLPNPSESPDDPSDNYTREVLPEGGFVAYTEDLQGELYAIKFGSPGIFKLEAGEGGGEPTDPVASTLSGSGCFDATGEAASGLIPYDLNAPLWSDGASKRRWLSLPDGQNISVEADGDFTFPPGTVLAKEFTLDGVRVETRLFMRHPDGVWAGYSYAWIDDAGEPLADAVLLPDQVVTRTPATGETPWSYPSRSQCTQCHTAAAGGSLGVEIGQLNRDFDYPGGQLANQISTLSHLGMLEGDLDAFIGRAFPSYDDEEASIDDRTWSYLHANCSGCHRPGAPGNIGRSAMADVSFDLFAAAAAVHPLAERLCEVAAGAGDLGLGAGALLVEPGTTGDWSDLNSGGSVLYLRMAARASVPGSTGTMPLIGSALLDEENGLPLVSEWIDSLSCP